MATDQIYWASVEGKDIADRIIDKVEDYYRYLTVSGRMDLWKRSWSYYYKPLMTGAQLNPMGAQGELTALGVNQYRNLLVHLETMTIQQRVSFEPRATNSDAKSQAQVVLANGLLDYYMREKRLERNIKQAVKDGLMFGEGFLRAEWAPKGGKVYGKSPAGADIYEGDMKYTNYTPLNCIRDYTLETPADNKWYILREFQNKYELAASFPDIAEDILDDSVDLLTQIKTTTLSALGLEESDNIPVYTLIHEPTPAVPKGRYTTVLGNGTKMLDGPLPYKKSHVYRLAPDEQTGSIFGYSVAFDLLPVQEALDILYSTIITNQSAFGVQNILYPKGSDLSVVQLAGGLNGIPYDPKLGEPKSLQLTQTPAEIFSFVDKLEQIGETLSGANSVIRGDPEKSLESGAALALVQSMAIQFSMNLQQSYAQIVEDAGTGSIQILQDFATVPRVATIAGKSNRPIMKDFKGSDLDQIERVMVDMGNPMTRTTAGKVNLAESLMKNNMIENPDQYIQVITTGRLEPVIESKQANLILIKEENEGLSDGQPQRALITDNHAQHIMEHKIVLANTSVRSTPNDPVVEITLAHIQEHISLAQSPGYQMMAPMLGHQLMVPPAAPPSPMGGPAGPMDANPPVQQAADQVNMPSLPTNPATGEQAPAPASPA